jgi:hypothetical protein
MLKIPVDVARCVSIGCPTAHDLPASDSPENARREMAIIRLAENNLKPMLEAHGLPV